MGSAAEDPFIGRPFVDPGGANPLAVVLLVSGSQLPRWQADALARLESERTIRVDGVIAMQRSAVNMERLCCSLQEAAEYLWRRPHDSIGAPIEARTAFPRAAAHRKEGSALSRSASGTDADLVVNCGVEEDGARGVQGRLGTLSCRFAGTTTDTGLFRALIRGDRILCLSVNLLTGDEEVCLERAWPALPDRPVLLEARRNVCSRAAGMLAKAIRKLAKSRRAVAAEARGGDSAPPPPVTALSAVRYGSRRAAAILKSRVARLSGAVRADANRNWFLAYRVNPDSFVRNTDRFSGEGYRLVLPPPGRFYADPCVIEHEGEDHVFFEEWRDDLKKGVISWMRREGDRLTPPEQVLEQPYHLSYPFVFRAEGQWFMVPESAAARRIELYRAADFPRRWEKIAVLLDGIAAVDSTLFERDGRWWMFANVAEDGSSTCDQLFLFHADKIEGPWRPHQDNPVKIDVRSTRPAGPLFRRGAGLIRPSQDCSVSYGGALTLCEVTRLSATEYAEVEVEKLLPGWLPGNLAFHTLSSSAGLEVIDGKMLSGRKTRFPILENPQYAEAPA